MVVRGEISFYRSRWRLVTPGCVLVLVSLLAVGSSDPQLARGVLVVTAVLFVLFAGETLVRPVVVLDRSALHVRSLRWRRIPWTAIEAVTLDWLGMEPAVCLVVAGRRVRLPAPSTYFGLGRRRCEEGHHVIERWWLANRASS